jgi:hypothetical protein
MSAGRRISDFGALVSEYDPIPVNYQQSRDGACGVMLAVGSDKTTGPFAVIDGGMQGMQGFPGGGLSSGTAIQGL